MKRRKVKITGIGPVTPAGIGREEFWKGILEPVSRVRAYTKFGEEYGPFVAASVPHFDVKKIVPGFEFPKSTARHTLFAAAGAVLALRDAGLTGNELRNHSAAVITGSSLLDFGGIGAAIEAVAKKGPRLAQARVVYTTTLTAIPDIVNQVFGINSRTLAVQTSCCAGLDAIGQAARLIAEGEIDIAICGGTEAPLHRFPMLELRAAGLTPPTTEMSDRIARPFDLWRTTGVIGEGACMFVLEPDESPRPGYARISGYAYYNDSQGNLCGGLVDSGKLAIADAHLRPGDIECINAWGPGHKLIDEAEVRAMEKLFGSVLGSIPAVSIKGSIGAPLGAAPAIQVGAAALGIQNGLLPPTVNWQYPDPNCALNLSTSPRAVTHGSTLVNAHGVGNVNSSMILTSC